MPVEVQPSHVGARHPVDDSVRIDHWNYKDLEVRSQICRNGAIRDEKFHEFLGDE